VQAAFFKDTRISPFTDHPPDHAIRHSLVEDPQQCLRFQQSLVFKDS